MDIFASMKAFVAVAEEGGFAGAARKAGLATSSVTRQVDALEAQLGVALFNRSTRNVTLTPAGETYLGQAIHILSDLVEANRSVSERDGPPRGRLRVSLPVAFARLHVAPLVSAFLDQCPEVELELTMTDTVVNLVEDRIDVAIRLGGLESSRLIARRLAPHRRVVCASPAYLDRYGTPKLPADLSVHDCLTFSYAAGDRTWLFRKQDRGEQVRVRGNLRANHSESLVQAAIDGVGIILMPTWLVGRDLAQGRLCQVLGDWDADAAAGKPQANQVSGIHAVYLPDKKSSRKVQAFIDFLIGRFGAPPYWDKGYGETATSSLPRSAEDDE